MSFEKAKLDRSSADSADQNVNRKKIDSISYSPEVKLCCLGFLSPSRVTKALSLQIKDFSPSEVEGTFPNEGRSEPIRLSYLLEVFSRTSSISGVLQALRPVSAGWPKGFLQGMIRTALSFRGWPEPVEELAERLAESLFAKKVGESLLSVASSKERLLEGKALDEAASSIPKLKARYGLQEAFWKKLNYKKEVLEQLDKLSEHYFSSEPENVFHVPNMPELMRRLGGGFAEAAYSLITGATNKGKSRFVAVIAFYSLLERLNSFNEVVFPPHKVYVHVTEAVSIEEFIRRVLGMICGYGNRRFARELAYLRKKRDSAPDGAMLAEDARRLRLIESSGLIADLRNARLWLRSKIEHGALVLTTPRSFELSADSFDSFYAQLCEDKPPVFPKDAPTLVSLKLYSKAALPKAPWETKASTLLVIDLISDFDADVARDDLERSREVAKVLDKAITSRPEARVTVLVVSAESKQAQREGAADPTAAYGAMSLSNKAHAILHVGLKEEDWGEVHVTKANKEWRQIKELNAKKKEISDRISRLSSWNPMEITISKARGADGSVPLRGSAAVEMRSWSYLGTIQEVPERFFKFLEKETERSREEHRLLKATEEEHLLPRFERAHRLDNEMTKEERLTLVESLRNELKDLNNLNNQGKLSKSKAKEKPQREEGAYSYMKEKEEDDEY